MESFIVFSNTVIFISAVRSIKKIEDKTSVSITTDEDICYTERLDNFDTMQGRFSEIAIKILTDGIS